MVGGGGGAMSGGAVIRSITSHCFASSFFFLINVKLTLVKQLGYRGTA